MTQTNRFTFSTACGLILVLLSCSSSKVMVPPKINLQSYNKIGLIEFSINTKGNLAQFASQTFMQSLQSDQTGVRILELGDEEHVLQSVQQSEFTLQTIVAIGQLYKIDALFIGQLDVSDIKPDVELSTLLKTMSAGADVEASLTTRLYETQDAATIWTDSSRRRETIAHVTLISNGIGEFDASDPETAYGRLVNGLVRDVTRDFRVRYK